MGSETYSFMNLLNKKRTVQNTQGETCAELYERLNEGYGLSLRNFQERFNGKNEVRFSMKRIASKEEVAIMEKMYPRMEDKMKRVVDNPAANVPPVLSKKDKAKSLIDWHTVSVRFLFGFGVIAHAVLILYECWKLWGNGGAIAGSIVFLVIASSVLQIAKKPQGDTAENLLYLVWLLDLGAWFVHKASLYHFGDNAYAAGIDEYGTGCLALVICVCAGAMMYFYRVTGLKTDKK